MEVGSQKIINFPQRNFIPRFEISYFSNFLSILYFKEVIEKHKPLSKGIERTNDQWKCAMSSKKGSF